MGRGEEGPEGRFVGFEWTFGKFEGCREENLDTTKCTDRNTSDFILGKKVRGNECGSKVSLESMKDENFLGNEKKLIFGKAVSRKVRPRASSVDFAGKFAGGNKILGKFGEHFAGKNIFAMNGRRSAQEITRRDAKLDSCRDLNGGLLTERLFEAVRKTDCTNFQVLAKYKSTYLDNVQNPNNQKPQIPPPRLRRLLSWKENGTPNLPQTFKATDVKNSLGHCISIIQNFKSTRPPDSDYTNIFQKYKS